MQIENEILDVGDLRFQGLEASGLGRRRAFPRAELRHRFWGDTEELGDSGPPPLGRYGLAALPVAVGLLGDLEELPGLRLAPIAAQALGFQQSGEVHGVSVRRSGSH